MPGTWSSDETLSNRFEPTRPGVLWHCQYVQPQYGCSSTSSQALSAETSWSVDNADVFGRSIPQLKAGRKNEAGGFVSQDNTSSVGLNSKAITSAKGVMELPESIVIRRGTVLSDGVMCGDVEALFDGRTSITTLQTWPSGHPFSLTDVLLAYTLVQGQDGLPAWLV